MSNLSSADTITLPQTTNLRLFQTGRFADDNFIDLFDENGRQHCGEREKLRAISPFLAVFSKDLHCRNVKKKARL